MNPIVSVIIPVYNAEKTLRRCVESIVYGKLQDLEVILVEDHSKDDSWQLCCVLAEENACVRAVRNPKNCGVSYTRNHGLQEAQGEYALFVDSDDWVSGDFASTLLRVQIEHSDCLPLCGFMYVDMISWTRTPYLWNKDEAFSVVERATFSEMANRLQIQNVWNKLFKMDIIRQRNLCFDESVQMGEDFQFVLDYIEKGEIQRCAAVNRPLYYYVRYHHQSLMSGFVKEPFARAAERLKQLAQISNSSDKVCSAVEALRQNYTYHIVRHPNMTKKEKQNALALLWPNGERQCQYWKQMKIRCKESAVHYAGVPLRVLKRIKGRCQRDLQKHKINRARRNLKRMEFTLIAQNCIGGVFYHDMGLEFLSPTVNLYLHAPDFLKFVENLKYYIEQPIQMRWGDEFPVGTLDDVTIFFMHYDTCTEAREAWIRRKNRIMWDSIIVLCTDRGDFGPQEYALWQHLPYRKLLFTTHHEYSQDSVYFPEYYGRCSVPDLIPGRKFYKDNRIFEVINSLQSLN